MAYTASDMGTARARCAARRDNEAVQGFQLHVAPGHQIVVQG